MWDENSQTQNWLYVQPLRDFFPRSLYKKSQSISFHIIECSVDHWTVFVPSFCSPGGVCASITRFASLSYPSSNNRWVTLSVDHCCPRRTQYTLYARHEEGCDQVYYRTEQGPKHRCHVIVIFAVALLVSIASATAAGATARSSSRTPIWRWEETAI